MRKLDQKSNVNFTEALALVLQGRFRRVSDIYSETKTGKYSVTIYRCSDTIVRAEFKKDEVTVKPKTIKQGE